METVQGDVILACVAPEKILLILENGVQSTIGIKQTVNVSWQRKVKLTLKLCTRIRMVAMTLDFGKSISGTGRLVMVDGLHAILVKILDVLRISTIGVEIHGHYGRLVKFVMYAIHPRKTLSIRNIKKIKDISMSVWYIQIRFIISLGMDILCINELMI